MVDWKNLLDTEKRYIKLFIQMVVEMVSAMSTSTLTTVFSSKIGHDYIVTGVGIASLLNIGILYSFGLGYGTVFESFSGSMRASHGNGAVGELVVKCALQGFIIYLLSLIPYFSFGYLVPLFGTDQNVHSVALFFMKLQSPRPLFLYMKDLLTKYLIFQGFQYTALITSVLSALFYIVLGWFCVVYMRWGLYGLAGAQVSDHYNH